MDDDLLERARSIGYELVERQWHGKPAWQWKGPGAVPFFLDEGEALRWMEDYLPRRRLA